MASIDQALLDLLREADGVGHIAYTRHLCECVLAQDPEHGPTLIRHACCLTALALYEESAAALDRAEKVIPAERRHLLLAQRGHLLQHMGDYETAEEMHLKAHELDPDDASYLIYAGHVAARRGDLARAEEHYRKAVACSEGCIDEAWFNLGGRLLARKRFEEARDCYLRALQIDPDYTIARKRLEDVELVLASQRAAEQRKTFA